MISNISESQFEKISQNRPFAFNHFILTKRVEVTTTYNRSEMAAIPPGEFGVVIVYHEEDESEYAVMHRLPLLYGGKIFQVSYFSTVGPLPVKFKTKSKAKNFLAFVADKSIVLAQIETQADSLRRIN